jgi:phosphoglycolate phosphatase-like HAD superfamily hydrolase
MNSAGLANQWRAWHFMELIIFDLDRTLVQSNQIGGEIFFRAWKNEFGLDIRGTDWDSMPHMTDVGITHEIFMRRFGRQASHEELNRIKDHILNLLKKELEKKGGTVPEVPGALDLISHLHSSDNMRPVIATGGWDATARCKMRASGLDPKRLPMATSDDAISRVDIVRTAINRATEFYGIQDWGRMVALGDARWDVKAAADLKLPFVGVGEDVDFTALGASHAVVDFSDLSHTLACLRQATSPQNGKSRPNPTDSIAIDA